MLQSGGRMSLRPKVDVCRCRWGVLCDAVGVVVVKSEEGEEDTPPNNLKVEYTKKL